MVRLGTVIDVVMGQAPPGNECNFQGEGTPFVKAGEFGVISPIIREWTTKPLKLGRKSDVFLCVVGATCGKINYGEDCAIGRSVSALRPKSEYLSQRYLYHFMSLMVEKLRSGSLGAAQTVISKEMINDINIPLPSLATQQKIVEKLDAIFAEIDRANVAIEANVKNAEALFQSYLTEVFERLFFKNKSVTLKSISKFENGDRGKNYPSKQHQVESGIPFVNAGDLKDDWKISRKGMAFITEERFNLLGAGKIKNGDLLFCLRGSLGKCGIVEDIDIGAIASSLVIIRPAVNVSFNKYIYWFLSSSICARYIRETSGGAAQPNLSAKSVMNYLIPLISYEEQIDISNQIDDFYLSVERINDSFFNKGMELNYLKQSILKQAFSGELVKE